MTQKILQQDEEFTLTLEFMGNRHGGWWLELIDRASGQVKILTALDKTAFKGVRLSHAIRWTEDLPFKPMYRKGKM